MWIPRTTYQATQRGFVLREVACEHCGTEFAYALSRESIGEGTSLLFLDNSGAEERAVETAAKKLEEMLANEVDPVPCPHCHLYQASMVQRLRDGSYWWMSGLALLGVIVAIILAAVLLALTQYNTIDTSTMLGCGIAFIITVLVSWGLWVLQHRLSQAYEPNSDDYLDMRRSSKQSTMLKADVEKHGVDALLAPVEKAHARSDWSDIKFKSWLRMATGLMLAGIGVYFLIYMSNELIAGYSSSNWPTAKARVTMAIVNSKFEQKKEGMVTYYFPDIAYAYEVQGNEFTGSRFRFEPVISRDQTEIQALVQPIQSRAEIEIHYNPSNPSDSVIHPGLSSTRIGLAMFMGCLALGGLGFFGYEVRRYLRLHTAATEEIGS